MKKQYKITDDETFCAVMEDADRCKEFLERVLGIKIASIYCDINQKSIRTRKRGKGARLDVYVRDVDGNSYDIEIQTYHEENIAKRSRYYHSAMDNYQIGKGASYEDLRKNIVIFVCTYDPFGLGRSVYTFRKRCEEDGTVLLEDDVITFILNTEGDRAEVSTELTNVLDYFKTGECKDEFTKDIDAAVHKYVESENERGGNMTLGQELEIRYRRGKREGTKEVNMLVNKLMQEKRYEDLERASIDTAFQNELFKEFGIGEY